MAREATRSEHVGPPTDQVPVLPPATTTPTTLLALPVLLSHLQPLTPTLAPLHHPQKGHHLAAQDREGRHRDGHTDERGSPLRLSTQWLTTTAHLSSLVSTHIHACQYTVCSVVFYLWSRFCLILSVCPCVLFFQALDYDILASVCIL